MAEGRTAADDPLLRVADAVGRLMEFWGFRRAMGRMWGLLYLEPAPMSAKELGDRLAMSVGAVSMTLAELLKWGVVKKTWVVGERRDYYEPETSIWKMVSRVFREREMAEIRSAIEVFEAAIGALARSGEEGRAAERPRHRFAGERVQTLLALARIGERLLRAVLSGESVDSGPLAGFLAKE